MIYVTQGYEKSASLHLFLKALSCFPNYIAENFTLILEKSTLANFGLDHFDDDYLYLNNLKIPAIFINRDSRSISQATLETALELIEHNDQLFTLPTMKNQLILGYKNLKGYTEFFRSYFNNDFLAMTFKSESMSMVLLSDHIPLREVPKLKANDCLKRIQSVLESKYFEKNNLVFLGINPHAGENGLLGNEDSICEYLKREISKKYKHFNLVGPIAADSSLISRNNTKDDLFISAFHDQGLSLFKSHNGLHGANITLGLPFLRYSVDHGTAPGKTLIQLNYMSYLYLINLMLEDMGRLNGK